MILTATRPPRFQVQRRRPLKSLSVPGMGGIARRPDGRWRARYRDAAGKEHSKHFARKVDAQRWLDETTAAVVTGQYIDPKSARVTVAEYAAKWEAAQVGRDGTARITDNALRLHILPMFGSRPMQSVLRSDVQMMVKALSERLAPGTVRNVYDTLARMYGIAVDDRIVASSPCRRIVLPSTDDEGEVHPPTAAQVSAIVAAAPARYRSLVVLLAGSGMRIGEALGLQVSDVDFLRRTVRVERQRLQNGKLGPTKTAKSVRPVPVGEVVIAALAAHLAAHPSTGDRFTATKGQPLRYGAWKNVWASAHRQVKKGTGGQWSARYLDAAGQEHSRMFEGKVDAQRWLAESPGLALDTHDLRHFYASGLIAGGANVKQVQVVLGHASPVITLRIYAHLWPGDEDRIRSISDAVLGGLRTSCGLEAV
jgi:integrase